jgi:hypothetical protein
MVWFYGPNPFGSGPDWEYPTSDITVYHWIGLPSWDSVANTSNDAPIYMSAYWTYCPPAGATNCYTNAIYLYQLEQDNSLAPNHFVDDGFPAVNTCSGSSTVNGNSLQFSAADVEAAFSSAMRAAGNVNLDQFCALNNYAATTTVRIFTEALGGYMGPYGNPPWGVNELLGSPPFSSVPSYSMTIRLVCL